MKWFFLAIFAGFLMIGSAGHAVAIEDIEGYEKVSESSSVKDWSSYLDEGVLKDGVYNANFKDEGILIQLGVNDIKCVYQNTQSMTENIASWYSYAYAEGLIPRWYWWGYDTGLALYRLRCSNGCDAETGLCKPEIAVPEGYELSKNTARRTYRCGECYGEAYDTTGQPCFGWFEEGAAIGVEPNSFGYFYLGSDEAPTNVCFSGNIHVYFREGDRSSPDYAGEQRDAGAYFCDSFGRTYYNKCNYGCSELNIGYCAENSESDNTNENTDEDTSDDANDDTSDDANDDTDNVDPENEEETIIPGRMTYSSHGDSFINYKERACEKIGQYACKSLSKFPGISLLWYCGMDSQLYFTLCPGINCNSNEGAVSGYCDIS